MICAGAHVAVTITLSAGRDGAFRRLHSRVRRNGRISPRTAPLPKAANSDKQARQKSRNVPISTELCSALATSVEADRSGPEMLASSRATSTLRRVLARTMSGLYEAHFSSADDPELDAETTAPKDSVMSLDGVVVCRGDAAATVSNVRDPAVAAPEVVRHAARCALSRGERKGNFEIQREAGAAVGLPTGGRFVCACGSVLTHAGTPSFSSCDAPMTETASPQDCASIVTQ